MSRIEFHFGAPIPTITPLRELWIFCLMGFAEKCTTKHLSHSYAGTTFSG